MRTLISGITGFAGSHLAEHLLALGDEVAGFSSRGVWPLELAPLARRVPLFAWDIRQPADGDVWARFRDFRPHCVYHLAGISVPSDCGEDRPTPLAEAINVTGVRHLLEVLERLPEPPRLLLASSSHVYGQFSPEDGPAAEESFRNPTTAYGQTKRAAEEVVQAAVAGGRPEATVIVRAFNHTGPRQKPPLMLPEWTRQLVRGANPLQVRSLDSWLDLTDVRDVVVAYRRLACCAQGFGIYDVGSGRRLRCGDILAKLLRRYDASREVEPLSAAEQRGPVADLTRLRQVIDWRPQISLERTLDDTLQYWMERERQQ